VAGSARTTRTMQARGQLSRHHSEPCPRGDEADEALQMLHWAFRRSAALMPLFLPPGAHAGQVLVAFADFVDD
jgi:hypothetical protein